MPNSAEHAAAKAAPKTMVEIISMTLADEMARDDRIVVFGEDVADCTREDYLNSVKGKGGVFKATMGLQRRFGSARVFNTPIAEAGIIGRAIGMAVRGLKPVTEIQFFDYIWPAMMQLRNELSNMRWRSAGHFKAPVVVRVAIGGYLTGGGIYHSQSGEVTFTHIPGLRVVMPSTALDLCGLLAHRVTRRRSGDGAGAQASLQAAVQPVAISGRGFHDSVREGARCSRRNRRERHHLRRRGSSLRSGGGGTGSRRHISGDHRSPVAQPLRLGSDCGERCKTNRVIVAYEDSRSWGYGAEIAARIADELFDELDAPVRRVAATDTFCAYHPALEDAILPQSGDIARAVRDLAAY